MAIVLVHGVPETPDVWELLRANLGTTDVVALRLPGFGSARPAGFGATKEEYVEWLVGEVERLNRDGPVDLVGHDWGGGLVVRLVSIRPELVRSWVTDAAGVADEAHEWHDFAKLWQTAGAGEEFWDQQLARSPEERSMLFQAAGAPADLAVRIGAACDRAMADCILALYRSAVSVGQEWAPEFKNVPAPGLVVVPSDDPFLSVDSARAAAGRAGAAVADLAGLGHWWMLQDPVRGAATLEAFWASLGRSGPATEG